MRPLATSGAQGRPQWLRARCPRSFLSSSLHWRASQPGGFFRGGGGGGSRSGRTGCGHACRGRPRIAADAPRCMVSQLPTSRSSGITEADLERLAGLCQRLEEEDAARSGREAVQVHIAAEVRALRLLLEEADLRPAELEKLVLRLRGQPLSQSFHAYLGPDASKRGWSGESLLPALRRDCGMCRRQVAEAVLKFPDLLCTYTGEPATLARRLRWHLCTDWATRQELDGEGSLAATLAREPRLLGLDRDALKVKIHELLRLIVNPELPPPDDIISGTGPIYWDLHYCEVLQPALRDHPRALIGKGVKNLRQRVTWTAENLGIRQRATQQAARLLVVAAGLDVKAIESRVKMLRQAAGLDSPAALRGYLLEAPEVLLVDAKSIDAAAKVLAERCPDPAAVQAALQRLLREHGPRSVELAATVSI